ncbi:MAG: CarD family transcriptional regulator [Oscillospiraceae bacterium]|nr:CarD family transcriptional regulator [Oscillospiraceae bacterium]
MFSVGDKIVHPMHGAGYVDSVVVKDVSGEKVEYYVMKISDGRIVVMIPVGACDAVGVRQVVSTGVANDVMEYFNTECENMTDNWNRRYRENMVRLKSGDLMQVAVVVKGLLERDMVKGLSTGERKMLHSAKQILVSELVMALDSTEEEIEARILKSIAH